MEHPDDLRARLTWCLDDAARRRDDDCRNALTAAGQRSLGAMKDLPPIDWNRKP